MKLTLDGGSNLIAEGVELNHLITRTVITIDPSEVVTAACDIAIYDFEVDGAVLKINKIAPKEVEEALRRHFRPNETNLCKPPKGTVCGAEYLEIQRIENKGYTVNKGSFEVASYSFNCPCCDETIEVDIAFVEHGETVCEYCDQEIEIV